MIQMNVAEEPTDEELLNRMALDDREAFALVFRRHQRTVYRFSRQMLGSKEAAEDVTQEVFLALARSAGRFDATIGSLPTYLYGIARNLMLQRYKRSRPWKEVNIETIDGEDVQTLQTSADPVETLSRAQAIRRLRTAILRLPVHYREAIVLCELNGLSYEDAATIAGCPVGTVRSRLSRARQMLIARCRLLFGEEAERNSQRAESNEQSTTWLIPKKNNC
jgi:RNA polymerase sigma-70 factor (ECF subfamily)